MMYLFTMLLVLFNAGMAGVNFHWYIKERWVVNIVVGMIQLMMGFVFIASFVVTELQVNA